MTEAARPIEAPIIIFAFDRAAYLKRFCDSLKAQQGVELDPQRIYLLQDGPVSHRSGVRYADDAAMAESIAAFREVFPAGQVLASADNLGIAFNIRRGEQLAFETLGAETAYFFEDDLELGPGYMLMMERMRALLAPFPEVGYFAAYGDHRATPDPDRVRIVPLDHHWGFGLRRDAWKRLQEWLAPYFAILSKTDYQSRNHIGVYRWLEGQAMAIDKSSQDALKALACANLGIARVMTDMCFARYIGEKGASFNERRFREMGYDRMTPTERSDLPIEPQTVEKIRTITEGQQAHFRVFREREFNGFMTRYAARNWDSERAVTRADIDNLYSLLLDRLPEGEHIYDQYVGKTPVRRLRDIMINSREFRGRTRRD
ncbi:glycosyltransferase family 2 protein [Pseudoroseomonas globiformis]|uniref:Glycosyltransferase family 2 protein n=1 Tax=Teichococcus globiformis TaxID=2307229 RepID=A0ABV7G056_9PROT